MHKISQVEVKSLFGYMNHCVGFSTDSPITIISGPNGSGKTHLLKVLHAISVLDLEGLASIDFQEVRISFQDKRILRVVRQKKGGGSEVFKFFGRTPSSRAWKTLTMEYEPDDEDGPEVPTWVLQLPSGDWYDTRTERLIPAEMAKRRYNIPDRLARIKMIRGSWLAPYYDDASAVFIDTKRLDSTGVRPGSYSRGIPRHPQTRVQQYSAQVAAQVSEARRKSLNESLDADQSFAARMLQSAHTSVKEKELKERYQRIADQHAELHASGLSVIPVDVTFPDQKTTPTTRRILDVFLDDWERKLQPLLPIHEKLKLLRSIVETKFTGKALDLTARGILRFRSTYDGKPLPMRSLSSGEQHLFAVFTLLLFSTRQGSLVLIDEPEISMHAAWKHAFLEDIEEVARISDLQIALATHSSSVIRGRWDLVKEIKVPNMTPPPGTSDEDEPFEGLDPEVEA
ncbi:AAA family ATPase [Streptomyces sp. HU2014]|uniref:ATP-binding protein n=1 Tax=Streptomyces sp. HU2014 TaxID=2939414 RepID=UPI00200FE5F3|nr:ATP-binding protein [Streptomyces sp. HU2014]UQI47893.1 AAA family ATPase [Streptomyces sp. HU2014]